MKKNTYDEPVIEIQMFDDTDFVMTTSGFGGGDESGTNPDDLFGDF